MIARGAVEVAQAYDIAVRDGGSVLVERGHRAFAQALIDARLRRGDGGEHA